jgi:hypothetical protein
MYAVTPAPALHVNVVVDPVSVLPGVGVVSTDAVSAGWAKEPDAPPTTRSSNTEQIRLRIVMRIRVAVLLGSYNPLLIQN